jgi:energy-coupling factor transporter ATP-binding protein EcfA2
MTAANAALAMPYPGLRPFEDKDQPLFFGREAQVSAMLHQLEDHRFVAVVGSSGSGKSSLVRAGLLPAVREGFLLGTTDWLTIIIKPGHRPYQRLVRELSMATCRTEGAKVVPAYDDPLAPDETATLALLRRTDRGLLTALDRLAISPQSRVMVVVDQFEELFAFRRAGVNRGSVASRDEAAAFVGMLIRSASEPTGRVWAILTMRSDFIGDCEAFLGLPEEISHSQFLVPRLDRGQMEDAIVRPAGVKEGAFQTFTFKEGLVNRIINDAGDRPDQLPLMQHALMRTWKHAVARTGANGPVTVMPEDYETAGGIEMALSLHADAAWDEIKDDPKKAHIARRLFLLLCDISPDGQITRRHPQVTEIQAVTGASVAEIEQVVRVFQRDDRNFLLPPPPQHLTAESYLDICHEALLRQWRLFAGEWQEEERRDASELRRLAELASLRKQGQDVGLLPAQDLERIARWKERVSTEWARRYVTKEAWWEAISFVEESRAKVKREEEQRQKQAQQKRALVRWVTIILIVATGVSIWAAVYSWRKTVLARKALVRAKTAEETAKDQARKADAATAAAQEALTQSFVRTIGVSDDYRGLTPDERAALWELAELDPANAPVRQKVIDYWFQIEESSGRALKREAVGLHAAVGLNSALRKHSASKVTERAEGLTKAMENSQATEAYRLSTMGEALAALAGRMESKEAAGVSSRGAQVLAKTLENSEETHPFILSMMGKPLAALAGRMESKEAAGVLLRGAQVLAKALENSEETNPVFLPWLGKALAALAARMESKEAAGVAEGLAKALENSQRTDPRRLSRLGTVGEALAALAARMESKEAAGVSLSGAQVLAKALENSQATDADSLSRLGTVGEALAALAARMESKEAAGVSSRGAQVLAKALENSQGTDPRRLSRLGTVGEALAALAARMESKEAAGVSLSGAQVLAKALENSQGTDTDVLSSIGWSLRGLARLIPPARQTQLAALSNMLLQEFLGVRERGKEEPERRKLADLYALLEVQDLAEVLKWPFCVGEAEKIALAELEKKTGRKFGDDIWKFVEQAPSLAPAKRPKVEAALKELKSVATGGEVPRSSGGK